MKKQLIIFTTLLATFFLGAFRATASTVDIFRLYSPSTGVHLYTADANEYTTLAWHGWNPEGINFEENNSGTPVYRLYNATSGEHLYTRDTHQIQILTTSQGWKLDNNGKAVFYSSGTHPIFGLYNGKLQIGPHFQTSDVNEKNILLTRGWKLDGSNSIAWNAVNIKTYPVPDYEKIIKTNWESDIKSEPWRYTLRGATLSVATVARDSKSDLSGTFEYTVTLVYSNPQVSGPTQDKEYITPQGKIVRPPSKQVGTNGV